MSKYGDAAIRAMLYLNSKAAKTPKDAWEKAVHVIFPESKTSQEKGCPRGAFLGLCEEGLIVNVKPDAYTKSQDNKRYAIDAVTLLYKQPSLTEDRNMLWKLVMNGVAKRQNSQMDVVIALWKKGFIVKNKPLSD